MPPTSNPNQKVLITGIIVAVCILVGSTFVAYQIGYGNGSGTKTVSQTQNNAQPVLTESRLVIGTVEKVSGQEITLTNFKRVPDFTASSTSQAGSIVITIDQSTVIERLIQKDIAVISKERALSTSTPLTPPEPFTRVKITLGDIKVGDVLAVTSAEDISKLAAFTATKVEVQDIPKLPAPTTATTTATSTTVKVDATQRPAPPLPPEARKAQ
jgi:hypothetical protein